MLGLGAYSSSSEDEGNNEQKPQPSQPKVSAPSPIYNYGIVVLFEIMTLMLKTTIQRKVTEAAPEPVDTKDVKADETPESAHQTDQLNRPMVGPSRPVEHTSSPANETPSQSRKSSPLSSTRALIRDMTLPPVPNLDIPPSPPGSPDPTSSKKFEHFLSLKKQGVHFNEKLASSASLRNPSLMSKMMEHAGIDDKAQYATSLPTNLWDVSALPSWGFKEELQRSQQNVRRKLEERRPAQREAIDFVPSTSAGSSRNGTPAGGRPRQSAAERVMSGLGRDVESPGTTDSGKKYDLEHRPGRSEQGQKRARSRSPPGRRKR